MTNRWRARPPATFDERTSTRQLRVTPSPGRGRALAAPAGMASTPAAAAAPTSAAAIRRRAIVAGHTSGFHVDLEFPMNPSYETHFDNSLRMVGSILGPPR